MRHAHSKDFLCFLGLALYPMTVHTWVEISSILIKPNLSFIKNPFISCLISPHHQSIIFITILFTRCSCELTVQSLRSSRTFPVCEHLYRLGDEYNSHSHLLQKCKVPYVYIDLDTSLMFVAKKFPKHIPRGTFYS